MPKAIEISTLMKHFPITFYPFTFYVLNLILDIITWQQCHIIWEKVNQSEGKKENQPYIGMKGTFNVHLQ